jgi:hypothetical protein
MRIERQRPRKKASSSHPHHRFRSG